MAVDICVLGSLNVDVVTRVAALPKPGETIIGLGLEFYGGGKGLNQAVGAARLGASVAMVGATGDDEGGRMLRNILHEVGVDLSRLSTIPDQPSGQAHICVSADGQNMIVVTPGANAAMTADLPIVADDFDCRVALCQFETPYAAIDAFLDATGEARKIINAAPAQPTWVNLFEKADVVIVNEPELMSYAGTPIGDTEGSIAAAISAAGDTARRMIARPGQAFVVTLGAGGCIGVTENDLIFVAGHKAHVVDTTGAGDCFCGAVAAALAWGWHLRDALSFANKAAAIAVERHGASTSMPTMDEVEARF